MGGGVRGAGGGSWVAFLRVGAIETAIEVALCLPLAGFNTPDCSGDDSGRGIEGEWRDLVGRNDDWGGVLGVFGPFWDILEEFSPL